MVAIVAEKLDKAPTSKQFTHRVPDRVPIASKADFMTWETIRSLIHDEWAILLLLLLWSVAGVAVICERIYALWSVLAKSEVFKNRVLEAVGKGDLAKAGALCETANDPLSEVFGRGLRVYAKTPQKTAEAVSSQRMVALAGFKRYLWALGTVGSSAPFVGLFGTVVGILKAFQSMSQAGTGGFKVVSQGIAAALVATAAGLLVAIYAIIAYNYFVAKIGAIGVQYKVFCEEFLFALGDLPKSQGAAPSLAQSQAPEKTTPS